MAMAVRLFLILLMTLHSSTQQVTGEMVLEEGYTVWTVLDGNKLETRMNPTQVLPHLGGTHDLVVLDTPNSVFYSVSLPVSQDSEIKRISGNGNGFSDGDLDSAMFDHPRGFTLDTKGNVYVADKANHVIRKISRSGVTTIAGGHSQMPGKVDGPAQDASFSDDFDLEFIPDLCALLITDRGNRLIRQMNLKSDDCGSGSKSQLQMGLASSAILGVSCLVLGLAIGCIVSYQYLKSRECISKPRFSETWKHSQIRLGRRVPIVCSDIKSAIASSEIYSLVFRIYKMSLSHLSLMFNMHRVEQIRCRQPVNFLDSDDASNHDTRKSQNFADQVKDLMTFDEDLNASEITKETAKQGDCDGESSHKSLDCMMQANILDFARQSPQQRPPQGPLGASSGLVRRK